MEECIEARALKKSSFLSEFSVNTVTNDDFFYMNGVINAVTNDDFSVDGFLDLSSDDFVTEDNVSLSISSLEREEEVSGLFEFSGSSDSGTVTADDLSIPADDMENLEWLSQIVDDSASELSLLCPAGNYIPKTVTTGSLNRFEPPIRTHTPVLCFPSTVPAKARTKRPRTGGRSWSGGSPESSAGDCSPTSTLIFSNTAWNAWNPFQTVFGNADVSDEVVKPSSAKKVKRRLAAAAAADGSLAAPPLVQRRCTHCQVQKTPQWRNGPHGPKTLCNACGVRFKSGRLFPEYRPACSPTFSGKVHSNSHRKVLEMRRKKEVTLAGKEPGLVM